MSTGTRRKVAPWTATIALALTTVTCRRAEGPRPPPSPPAPPESAPSAEGLRRSVTACLPDPTLVPRPGCALPDTATAPLAACADFRPEQSPDVDVLSVVVASGAYDVAHVLGIPSMQSILDGGTPSSAAVVRSYREFEGPRFAPLGDGRKVKLESRGLMLGGVVHWATLASPRAAFTAVVVQQIPLHDAPLSATDRAAIERWNLAAVLTCIDQLLWKHNHRE